MKNGVPMMKVLFKEIIDTSSPMFQNNQANFYQVLVFGKITCLDYWNGWDKNLPDPICEIEATLTGRQKITTQGKEYNNLTLIHKSIKYIYEQRD